MLSVVLQLLYDFGTVYTTLCVVLLSYSCSQLIANVHQFRVTRDCPKVMVVENCWSLFHCRHMDMVHWHRSNVDFASIPIVSVKLQPVPWIPTRWRIRKKGVLLMNQSMSNMLDCLATICLGRMVREEWPVMKQFFKNNFLFCSSDVSVNLLCLLYEKWMVNIWLFCPVRHDVVQPKKK